MQSTSPTRSTRRRGLGCIIVLAALLVAGRAAAAGVYDVHFMARFLPSQGLVKASIRVQQDEHLLRRVSFPIEPERFFDFTADGGVQSEAGQLVWEVPPTGGTLRYSVHVDHIRETAEYDARFSRDWALLRGSDLFPPGVTRTLKGARSASRVTLRPPPSWKALVPWEQSGDGGYRVVDPWSSYDRPSGWFIVGENLHVRKATIQGMRIRIAGPADHDVRAQDLKALLRWTLPALKQAAGDLPPSLLVVAAGDPMWRGGLSGPGSLYLHADRPLIERDGTSPVLHELVHVVMRAIASERTDWIVEGMAEYYSLEMLRRSGTVSEKDHERTLARLRKKAVPASALGMGPAGTKETARAALIMRELDAAIRERSQGARSLDDVLQALAGHRGVLDLDVFIGALKEVGGSDFSSLLPPRVPTP